MPAFLVIPAYLLPIFVLIYAFQKLQILWFRHRLLTKSGHAARRNHEALKKRLYSTPREPEERRTASP